MKNRTERMKIMRGSGWSPRRFGHQRIDRGGEIGKYFGRFRQAALVAGLFALARQHQDRRAADLGTGLQVAQRIADGRHAGQVDAAAIGLDNGDGDFTDNLAAGWTLSEVTSGIDLNADGDRADTAITSVSEAALGVDLNGDNDTADTFTNGSALNERAFGIQLSQVSYHDGEETVFMTVSAPTPVNGSGGEAASVRLIDNDAQTEVYLQAFDGRDNKLNATNAHWIKTLDPAEVDARARARQQELLDANGGRDAVIERGDLGFTPAPGAAIAFD